MIEQEHGAGGVGLQALRFDVRFEVNDDAFVAEADAEVLQAPVATAGLGNMVVELVAVDRDDVSAGGPRCGFAAAGAVVVVEHPPARDRIAQLNNAAADGPALDVKALAVHMVELSGLVAAVVLADEHFYSVWELAEAAVEVAGDPVLAGVGQALRRLGGVVALVVAEQHDLGAVVLAAQQPRLVVLVQRPPVVGVAVGPGLGFEAPAAVGVALEPHEGAVAVVPGAVFESVGVARAGGDLGADAEVGGVGLLAAAGGQLVDVAPQGAHQPLDRAASDQDPLAQQRLPHASRAVARVVGLVHATDLRQQPLVGDRAIGPLPGRAVVVVMSSPAKRTACLEEGKRLGSPSSARIVTDVSLPIP